MIDEVRFLRYVYQAVLDEDPEFISQVVESFRTENGKVPYDYDNK